jgi:subtilisin family serine protease
VVNCSFITSAGQSYDIVDEAFSNLVSRGVVVVAGAGNNTGDISGDGIWGNEDDQVPAALPEAMAVSAMDPNPMGWFDRTNCLWLNTTNQEFDQIAFFSNYSLIPHDPEFVHSPGAAIDVAAPGVHILSTYKNGDYAYISGTSMASPHAAGLVALYIAANGRTTNAEGVYRIRQALVDTGLPQTQWASYPSTGDPDGNPEPLAVPSENWVPQPTILGIAANGPDVQLSFNIVPGFRYTVQASPSLALADHWTDLTTTNGEGSLRLVNWSDKPPGARRFYRLKREVPP